MKHLLTILALFVFCNVLAQETHVPLPEYQEMVMTLNDNNTLTPLDKSDVITESRMNSMRRTLVYMKVLGGNATVVRAGNTKEKFVVNIQSGVAPDDAIELFKFDEVSEKNRKILLASISGGWGKTKDVQLPKQRLSFIRVKDGSFIISPESQLPPGEYVFVVNRPNISELGAGGRTIKGYCFSVK